MKVYTFSDVVDFGEGSLEKIAINVVANTKEQALEFIQKSAEKETCWNLSHFDYSKPIPKLGDIF